MFGYSVSLCFGMALARLEIEKLKKYRYEIVFEFFE
jgi:hypothetical protein